MRTQTMLIIGGVAVVPAVVVALVFASWDALVLASLSTGVVLEIGAAVMIQGDANPRAPEENLSQMKANRQGYVAGVEVPSDASGWKPLLFGLPALAVGAIAYVVLASIR